MKLVALLPLGCLVPSLARFHGPHNPGVSLVSGLCRNLTAPSLAVQPELPVVHALTPGDENGSPCPFV